jgi:hypothetical protein
MCCEGIKHVPRVVMTSFELIGIINRIVSAGLVEPPSGRARRQAAADG